MKIKFGTDGIRGEYPTVVNEKVAVFGKVLKAVEVEKLLQKYGA